MNLCIPINILWVYRWFLTDISNFIKILSKVIEDYKYKGGYNILIYYTILGGGDMNINIIDDNANNHEHLDLLSENGYSSFINIYNRLQIGNNAHVLIIYLLKVMTT